MKKLIFLLCVIIHHANAAEPLTTCPSGFFVTIEEPIELKTTCLSWEVDMGPATSCLDTPTAGGDGECYMYAPVGMSFTDDSGTYEFTDVCPMSD